MISGRKDIANGLHRFFYGRGHAGRRQADSGCAGKVRGWILFWGVCILIRYMLPFVPSENLVLHARIVDALHAQLNWGRQALVASHEMPLLPTLAAGVVESVTQIVGFLDAQRVLLAVLQVWSLYYLVRLAGSLRAVLNVALIFAMLALVPAARVVLLACDPAWAAVVPFVSSVFHTRRWFETRSLRDAIIASMCGGIMVFAGVPAMLYAAALVVFLVIETGTIADLSRGDRHGIRLLIAAPLLYGLGLQLLLSWLIMGDALFAWRPLAAGFVAVPPGVVVERISNALTAPVLVLALGGSAALAICHARGLTRPVYCLVGGAAGLLGAVLLCEVSRFEPAGADPLLAMLAVVGFSFAPVRDSGRAGRRRKNAAIALTAIFVLVARALPTREFGIDPREYSVAPPRDAITTFLDRYWQGARVVVPGLRAVALYSDMEEERFVARVDFYPDRFLEQATEEQLHLLVPPPNGRYYARNHVLADIHRNGRPWLLLEVMWPSGWQLWRCVLPPVDERGRGMP